MSATPSAAQPRRSGVYSLEVLPKGSHHVAIVVRRRGEIIARIDPNPGGSVSRTSLQVRFVAGHNILASWSCGSDCTTAPLFTPYGHQLSTLGTHSVSPDGRYALSVPTFTAPGFSNRVSLTDLATGRETRVYERPDAWNTCRIRWRPRRAVLVPCDEQTRPTTLRF